MCPVTAGVGHSGVRRGGPGLGLVRAVMENRAFFVKRIACRLSSLDRKRGGATFGPFRLPVMEAKKFR